MRSLHVLASLLAAFVPASATPTTKLNISSPLTFYVASQSQGILHIAFDPTKNTTASLSVLAVNHDAGNRPGWIKPYGDYLYSISRTNYPDNSSTSGGLFAFHKPQISTSSVALTQFSTQSSEGYSGVAIDVSPDGKTLAAANIQGSTVSVHPLSADVYIQPSTYIFKYNLTTPGPGWNNSQVQANPHHAAFDPTGRFMFVADRGADRIYMYAVGGPTDVVQIRNITLEPGSGPRHWAFKTYNETRSYVYLISELDNVARIFTLDQSPTDNVQFTLQQTISTLGVGYNRTLPYNRNMSADIAISNDGRFAYALNRNTVTLQSDNVAVFSIDLDPDHDATHLAYLGSNDVYGKIPRHLALSNDDDNRYLAIANQYSQSLVVLERDPVTGFASRQVGFMSLGDLDYTGTLGPMCISWD